MWVMQSGAAVRAFVGHGYRVNDIKVNNEESLFSASDDRSIRLWETATGACVRIFSGHLREVRAISLSQSATDDMTDVETWVDPDDQACCAVM
eukprot:CAMPEP_0204336424 /NCGR_PEP_ID=MMETSP0469-20131031/19523_1 /ASSEMBLY_ACC=CAM_ASM_000384 /TAXON_ID=2969 /ORGANISM="Oxyrrhis marina" /LENGTH=92 /DNA_ID=CAMNT_0051320293 /DNA_START=100 /DNA_END=378 /DNA_ORIENTATION=+